MHKSSIAIVEFHKYYIQLVYTGKLYKVNQIKVFILVPMQSSIHIVCSYLISLENYVTHAIQNVFIHAEDQYYLLTSKNT